ncbi:MAG: hypothetical protein AAGB15_07935 [Pseudomonadota bacterium]
MTDVLKIALDRRAQLNEEVAKLDEFIRMAETLMSSSQGGVPTTGSSSTDSGTEPGETAVRTAIRRTGAGAEPSEVARPSIIRRGANAAG